MKLVLYLLWKEITLRRKSLRLLLVNIVCPLTVLGLTLFVRQSEQVRLWFHWKTPKLPDPQLTVYFYSHNTDLNAQLQKSPKDNDEFPDWVNSNGTSCSSEYLDLMGNQSDRMKFVQAQSIEHMETLVNEKTLEDSLAIVSFKNLRQIFPSKDKQQFVFGAIFREQPDGEILGDDYDVSEPLHIEYRMGQLPTSKTSADNVPFFLPLYMLHEQILARLFMFQRIKANVTGKKYKFVAALRVKPNPEVIARQLREAKVYAVVNWSPIICFTFVFPLAVLSCRILSEKASRMKELMQLCGVRILAYYMSFFILDFTAMFVLGVLFTLIFIDSAYDSVSYYYLGLTLFALNSVLFAIATSTFFNRPAVGVACFAMLYISSFIIPFTFLSKDHGDYKFFRYEGPLYLPLWLHLFLCLVGPPGFALDLMLTLIEERKVIESTPEVPHVVTLKEFFQTTEYQHSILTPGTVLMAMCGSVVLWLFIIFYIGEIWPWQPGVPRSILFPFDCCLRRSKHGSEPEPDIINPFFFEEEPKNLSVGIEMLHVKKRFGLKREAIKGVSLRLYFGQITVLLGHNGAGKSTLMNVVTGMIPATSGRILINGYDVETNLEMARRQLGLCPQTNVMYEDLTVYDNLHIFCLLKGCPLRSIKAEIDRVVELLSLTDKRNTKCKKLSGGMKRRLQVGMAIVGGSKILILDEPSSGLDIEARREIWDLLLSVRKQFLILLTTHHMEEADCLGDRVAIMHGGEIKCVGSTMFMKKMFGPGYFLRIEKSPKYQAKRCRKLVKRHFKTAKEHKETTSEIIFNFQTKESKKIANFLEEFENGRCPDIKYCGVTSSSLDDVFVKVGTIFHTESDADKELPNMDTVPISRTFTGQFVALFCKRVSAAQRSLTTVLIFLYVALMALLLVILMTIGDVERHNGYKVQFVYPGERRVQVLCRGRACMYFNVTKSSVNVDYFGDEVLNAYLEIITAAAIEGGLPHCVNVTTGNESDVTALTYIYNALMNSLEEDAAKKIGTVSASLQSGHWFEYVAVYSPDLLSLLMMLTFCLNFISPYRDMVSERLSQAKLLQMMTGLHPVSYWLCSFLYDFLWVSIVSLPLTVAQPLLYQIVKFRLFYVRFESIVVFYMCFTISTCYLILYTYVSTYLFNSVPSGIFAMTTMQLLQGFFAVMLLKKFDPFDAVSDVIDFVLRAILFICMTNPTTQMAVMFTNIHLNSFNITFCDNWRTVMKYNCTHLRTNNHTYLKSFPEFCCGSHSDNVFTSLCDIEAFFFAFVASIVLMCIFFVIILALDPILDSFKMFRKRPITYNRTIPSLESEDKDVAEERQRTNRIIELELYPVKALTVHNLTKSYGKKLVVDRLSFSVDRNQCFGFLGVNGAGKSTTFKMLVGDLTRTFGDAYIGKHALAYDPSVYRQQIGYCPQYDCLLSNLTGRETLYVFGRLRGIHRYQLESAVENMIKFVDLEDHASNIVDTYSGGNKRKLCLGIALIGWPRLLLLDEPTAAVDPVARRKMWQVMENVLNGKRCSIVLTSHSMDECESLCEKTVIMVSGRLKCMGSTEHLKSEFGKGYSITVKLKTLSMDGAKVVKAIKEVFPEAELRDSHTSVMQFSLPNKRIRRAHLYRTMESMVTELDLENYEISEPNLEQIFLDFAKAAYSKHS